VCGQVRKELNVEAPTCEALSLIKYPLHIHTRIMSRIYEFFFKRKQFFSH